MSILGSLNVGQFVLLQNLQNSSCIDDSVLNLCEVDQYLELCSNINKN